MTRPPRPVRTLLLKFLLLLVAGAAVNVAVAWAAIWANGDQLARGVRHSVLAGYTTHTRFQPALDDFVSERGVECHVYRPEGTTGGCQVDLRAGLPLSSMRGTVADTLIIKLRWPSREAMLDVFQKVRFPAAPGFAINTIFYAAILWGGWLLFATPFAVRRRRRIKRGLCPACAYPVGTSDVCTECGKPVTPR